jgi:hypothetical protein
MKSNFKRVKQTQKKKQKKTKSDLWGKFDNMMGKSEEESMECLYTKQNPWNAYILNSNWVLGPTVISVILQ